MLPLASRRLQLLTPQAGLPFNPADYFDFLWDASVTSSYTPDGFNRVPQISELKGTGNHLIQATDAAKPLAGEFINGVPALDCRPDKHMTPVFPFFPAAGPTEVFLVCWSDRAASADNCFAFIRPASSTLNRQIMVAKTNFGNASLLGNAITRGNGTMRHTLIQHSYTEGTTGTIVQNLYIDGRLISGTTSCTGVSGTASSAFGTTSGTASFNSIFGMCGIALRTLTPAVRAKIIKALTAKWRALAAVSRYNIVPFIGDSQARGAYGSVNRVEDLTDPRIAMLERTYVPTTGAVVEGVPGEIVLAEHPFANRWRDTATPPGEDTVGPSMAYAKALLADLPSDEGVLIVPCAMGGTFVKPNPPLSDQVTWSPHPTGSFSNVAYLDALARTNYAISLGHRLHSIYSCIGTNDAGVAGISKATFAGWHDDYVNGFRGNIVGGANLPFVAMQVGDYLDPVAYSSAANINAAIAELPTRLAHTAYVSSAGREGGADLVHYTAAAQRLNGADGYEASKLAA